MNIFKNFAKTAVNSFIKNKPAIMTGIALVSLGTTVYVALHEGPRIKEILDEHEEEIAAIEENEELTEEEKEEEKKEEHIKAVKKIIPCFAKVGLATAITVFSIFAINKAHTAKEIAASALLESYKSQILQYEEKLPDVLGKKKAEDFITEVQANAAEDMSEKYGTCKEKFKQISYLDKLPVIDQFGSRWIASRDDLEKGVNFVNKRLCRDRGVDYMTFLERFGDDVEYMPKAKNLSFVSKSDDERDINFVNIEVKMHTSKILDSPEYIVTYVTGSPVDALYGYRD